MKAVLLLAVLALSSCDDSDEDGEASVLLGGGQGSDPNTNAVYAPSQGTPGTAQSVNGITITDFGYAGDLTPDPNSTAGIGNHDNSMVGYVSGNTVASAALSNDVAQQLGLTVGQSFTVTSANGMTYNLRYDDTSGTPGTIDVYNPSASLGGNNFSQKAISVTPMTHKPQ
jgi:hypothetical protein